MLGHVARQKWEDESPPSDSFPIFQTLEKQKMKVSRLWHTLSAHVFKPWWTMSRSSGYRDDDSPAAAVERGWRPPELSK